MQNPHLREALDDLYQGNYFIGINRLITLKAYDNLDGEQDKADILLGAFYLAYRMPDLAMNIFFDLADKGTSSHTLDQLWFYLAKTQYQRGDIAATKACLAQIRTHLGPLQQDRSLLEALVRMQEKQFRPAVDILKRLANDQNWSAFSRYNLGVALAKLGRKEDSIDFLEKVGNLKDTDDVRSALKDKANVTLGYIFLQDHNPERARNFFKQVQLNGPLSNKALLGLGWAYSDLNKHKNSLVAWMELAKRDKSDPSVMEALVATPYAFGKLNANKQSLTYYQDAITTLNNENKQIDALINSIREGTAFKELLQQQADNQANTVELLSLPQVPGKHYLANIFSSNEFLAAYKNYKDLTFLSGKLDEWVGRINKYEGVSATFRDAYMERIVKQQTETANTKKEIEDYLKQLAIDNLELQKKIVTKYVNQARFSVAQIYDQAARNGTE